MSYWIDQYSYYITEPRAIGAMMIMNFFLLVVFPAISIAMLSGLNIISGITMPKREDRIIPLIITLSLYIWYYINIMNNASLPDSLRFVALGLCLAVGGAFFINNFAKISLHTVGASGFVMALGLLLLSFRKSYIEIDLGLAGEYRVSAIFTFLGCIIMCGLVGSSRLYLKAHRPQEVYGGFILGALAQIVAYRIMM